MKSKIKVFLIEDHILFCESLKCLLEETGLFSVVGYKVSGTEALEFLGNNKSDIDIFLLDYYLPDTYGTELLRPIITARPQSHVVVLTADPDPAILHHSYRSGATAVLNKNAGKEKFIHTLVRVAGKKRQGPVLPPSLSAESERQPQPEDPGRLQVGYFTPRELEVLKLIAHGKTSREIAQSLFISFKTVENHRNNILQKSGAKNMIELINYLIKKKMW